MWFLLYVSEMIIIQSQLYFCISIKCGGFTRHSKLIKFGWIFYHGYLNVWVKGKTLKQNVASPKNVDSHLSSVHKRRKTDRKEENRKEANDNVEEE
jgi:hypothetical protein